MLFSIIIPVYNVEAYLQNCLDSLLRQTFCDWEALCVDDGSTDQSLAILEEYAAKDSRIKVIYKPNGGTASARNAGIKETQGDYLFFLDSDDWIEPNSLQVLAEHLQGEDVLCFSGKRYLEDSQEYRPADILPEKCYSSGMEYYNENALAPRDFAFVCVVLRVYKRSYIVENNLLFDESNSFEDNLWIPQVLYYAQSVKVVPDVLYIYRVREGSKMRDFSLSRKKDLLKVANRLAEFFIPKTGFDKTTVYRAITHHYQVVFVNVGKNNRKELKQLCDWQSYKKVSRTKLRHRFNYLRNKMI